VATHPHANEWTRQPAASTEELPLFAVRPGVFASTSRAAGVAMPDDIRANQRRTILNLLAADGALTYHQIAERGGIELQTVCWRMKELREAGDIRFATNADGSIRKTNNRRLVELASTPRAG
jgi:hypothetical protein